MKCKFSSGMLKPLEKYVDEVYNMSVAFLRKATFYEK